MSNSLHNDDFPTDDLSRKERHFFYPLRGPMTIDFSHSLDPYLASPAWLDFEGSNFGNHFDKRGKIAPIVGINVHPCQLSVNFGKSFGTGFSG